ncbi:MAG: hypothetical protein AB7G11_13110 [Phycisphaerales bacterium]
MVCGTHAQTLAEAGAAGYRALDVWSASDSGLLGAIGVCAAATAAAIGITWYSQRLRERRAAGGHDPLVRADVRAGLPHSALIDELLRTARVAHREGIGSLSHPLHRCSDADAQYAIDLVCSRADPRIVRGVLVGRMDGGEHSRAGAVRSAWLPLVSAVTLVAVCVLLIASWVVDRSSLNRTGAWLFAAWCTAAALWCFATAGRLRRDEASTRTGSLTTKQEIIVLAAEAIARGESAEEIERAIGEHLGRSALPAAA